MKNIKREITKEQFDRAVNDNDTTGIFSVQELMGYGVYGKHFLEVDGKYYVSYQLGDSCD